MQRLILLAFPFLAFAQSSSSSQSLSPSSSPSSAAPSGSTSAVPAINHGTNQYTYMGCYNETTSEPGAPRALTMGVQLNARWESEDDMTVEMCIAYCGQNNTKYAGLEYSRECWCGNFLSSDSALLPDSQCNSTCAGNSSEACGQSEKLLVYNRTGAASGMWAEGARSGALYASATTALVLGFGTLML
ncbi:WSC-domain-containing protein [Viridothelium virens]|uniref:WSC-domain-containing protein n=1 Tax=Viridothelium virens TaxID=1048519 RepID=A0A6A6HEL1_VIRVR|nr:WSC-domain-containing protein [Viridothelium virens]